MILSRGIYRAALALLAIAGLAGIVYGADINSGHNSPVVKKYVDQSDGTYAEAVALTGVPTVTFSGVPQVAVSSLPALPTGSNAIGKLAANSGVDIGDVDVTSLPALPTGANTIGAVDLRVASAAVSTSNPVPVRETVESLTYTHSNVSVDNASEALVASNASRKSLIISNDSDTKVYINLAGGTASATAGIPLAAGSSLVLSAGEKFFTTSAMTVITSSGTTKSVNVAEGQ